MIKNSFVISRSNKYFLCFIVLFSFDSFLASEVHADSIRLPYSYTIFPNSKIAKEASFTVEQFKNNRFICDGAITTKEKIVESKYSLTLDDNKYIIPISNYKNVIQPGDILVFLGGKSSDAMSLLLNNMTHAAVILQEEYGELSRLESPSNHSVRKRIRYESAFHILRLRQFPRYLDADPTFTGVARNKKEAMDILIWDSMRTTKLVKLNKNLKRIREIGYSFKGNMLTSSVRSSDLKKIQESLFSEEEPDLEFYCSELIYTAYELAGIKTAAPLSIDDLIMIFNNEILPIYEKKYQDLSKEELLRVIFREVLRHREALGIDKYSAAALERIFISLLSKSSEEQVSEEDTPSVLIMPPSEFYNSIYQEGSNLRYVGTFINGCFAD